jgi:hypothetical protein
MRAISTGRPRFEGDGSKPAVETTRPAVPRHAYPALPTWKIRAIVSGGPAGLIETAGACNQALSGRETRSLRPREASADDDDSSENLISCPAWSACRRIGKTPPSNLSVLGCACGPLGPRHFLTQGADTRRYRCRSGVFSRNQHLALSGAAQSNAGFIVRRPSLPARLLVLAGALAPKCR